MKTCFTTGEAVCNPPKAVTDQCVRHALTDGECTLHGCVDCPARLYEVPVIQIVDAPVVRFSERVLIAAIIIFAILGGFVGHSAVDRQESAYQAGEQ